MKVVKGLICMLLSLVILTLGIGYAQLSDELMATGNLNFTHTSLYLSRMTPDAGVTVTGYSGTLIVLNVTEAGKSITLEISNPTTDPYYYLNHAASNDKFTLSQNVELGAAVAASNGTMEFTVTFSEIGEYSIQFVFTVVPPEIGDGNEDDGFMSSTNATAVVGYVIDDLTYGLNSGNTTKAFIDWCNSSNSVLFCRDNKVNGANLNKIFPSIGAGQIYFTMEWVSETEYHIYLYDSKDAISDNAGKYIVAYQQSVVFNSTINKWVAGDSQKGYAKVVQFKNSEYQIEVGKNASGNNCVVWYASIDDLPDGAEVAG